MGNLPSIFERSYRYILGLVVLAALYLASQVSYLLFHVLAEFFSITVAFSILVMTWNSRQYLRNGYLMLVGLSSLFVGGIDLLHTLVYKGMNIIPTPGTDLPTQLWLAGRYLQSGVFFIAPLFVKRKSGSGWMLAGLAGATALLLLSIFAWQVFPTAFVEGQGLTPFKIASEYLFVTLYAISILMLWRLRSHFDPSVVRLLIASLLLSIATELAFTLYVDVYGFFNLLGHYFKILATYLLYKAIIETGFVRPYDMIFRELKRSEDALRETNNHLEEVVQERTRALEEQRALLEGIVLQAADAIVATDMQGRITTMNPAARRMAHLEENLEEISLNPARWGQASDRSGNPVTIAEWPLARALRGETTVGEEIHLKQPDGHEYDILISAAPLAHTSGEQIGAVAVFADITRRKQAETALRSMNQQLELRVTQRTAELEQANRMLAQELEMRKRISQELRASQSRLQRLVGSNLIGILSMHEDGKILDANEAVLAMTGYSREEITRGAVEWTRITPPEFMERDLNGIRQAKETGACAPYEKEYIRKDGSRVPILIGYVTLEDSPGEFMCFVLDLTRPKQAEAAMQEYAARLEASNRELQEFAYVASHDLQEPLRKVIAFGDRLAGSMDERMNERERDYLTRMQAAAVRMRGMINDLLALSRVTTQAQDFVAVNLNEIINEVLGDLEIAIEQNDARVIVEQLPEIQADPLQMRQLFLNIISNALKFRQPERPVEVRIYPASRQTGSLQLIIEDNGIGFEQQYAERIFQPFQRLHGRAEYEGTGMGLAIVQKILNRHHGSIHATSQPGQGARFIITLPTRQA